jgi:hypothetical protein
VNVYPFIEAEKAQQRNVKRACELLKISRAAYYAARAGAPSERDRQDAELTVLSRPSTSGPRAATASRGSTPSCAARGGGIPASGSPG